MKYIYKTLILLSLTFAFTGCKKKSYNINETIFLDYRKPVFINLDGAKYKMEFIELIEESRCKPGDQCISQGQVIVKIKIHSETEFNIGDPVDNLHYDFKGHIINFMNVNYDKNKNFGEAKHATVSLFID